MPAARPANARPGLQRPGRIIPATPTMFWSTVKMHRNHMRCSANGCERRPGQAERYDGCKDGSPDAHDSSKATLGLRLSALPDPRGTFAALWELLPLLAKAKPFGQK